MIFQRTELTCSLCSGPAGLECSSLDCPALYRRRAALQSEGLVPTLRKIRRKI